MLPPLKRVSHMRGDQEKTAVSLGSDRVAGITGLGGRLRTDCVADFTGIGNFNLDRRIYFDYS